MINAAIYVMRGEHQRELEQLVRFREWQLVELFDDEAKRRDRRPTFRALQAAVRSRRFDALVIYQSSAVAHTLDELVALFAQLQLAGVQLVSLTEDFESMRFADLVAALHAFQRDARRRHGGPLVGRPQAGQDETIVAMHSSGYSNREIARELGCGYGTVQRALDRAGVNRNDRLPRGQTPVTA